MTIKSYWRGYIDSQNKTNYQVDGDVVTHERKNPLKPLAELLKCDIKPYRSGYYVQLPDDWPEQLKAVYDTDYLRGWFACRGKVYKSPYRLAINGHPDRFAELVKKQFKITLPKAQRPSPASKFMRIIVTGDVAKKLASELQL